MKPKHGLILVAVLLCAAFTLGAHAQTTAITYQGRFMDTGVPAGGLYDLRFELYNDPLEGSLWGAVTNTAVLVSNGLFTVQLDFGSDVFDGADLWLEIGATTNGGGVFTTLSPRQPITSSPYAILAGNASTAVSVSGTVDAGQLTGTMPSNILADGSVTVEKLAPAVGVWTRSGSNVSYTAGQVGIGTSDIAADLHVRGAGAQGGVIVTPGAPDSQSQITLTENTSATLGAIMRYDGAVNEWQLLGLGGGGGVETSPHLVVTRDDGLVGVGLSPSAPLHVAGEIRSSGTNGGVITARNPNNEAAVAQLSWLNDVPRLRMGGIGAGSTNGFDIQGIGDVSLLRITGAGQVGIGTTVPEGDLHIQGNSSNGTLIVTPNTANSRSQLLLAENTSASFGMIMRYEGGSADNPLHFIGWNGDAEGNPLMTIERTGGGNVGIGISNPTEKLHVMGGVNATAFTGDGSGLTGLNADEFTSGTLPGSRLSGLYPNAVIFNNASNTISGNGADLTFLNASQLTSGTVPGMRLAGTYSATVAFTDIANNFSGTFLGDTADTAGAPSFAWSGDTDTGLFRPEADTLALTTGGTERMRVNGSGQVGIGTTGPEADLHIRGNSSTGKLTVTPNASDSQSQLLLAENTSASLGMILRNAGNEGANPLHFIGLNSGGIEETLMSIERNGGNVGIGTNNPAYKLHVVGNIVATGTLTGSSDRNLKENFAPVDAQDVLARVIGMPIQRWNYIGENVPHVGPVAQDFHGAFGVGMDDRHISMVDADGVALAAIQGLNQKLEETRLENAALRRQLEELRHAVEQLQKGKGR